MDWNGSDHSWSRASILMNAPKASGVYVIWNPQGCIVVGETHDLQRRLMDHHDHPTPCLQEHGPPTAFGFEICSVQTRTERQQLLARALRAKSVEPA